MYYPVAVFDLDGCLSQNPYHDDRIKEHCPDEDFWSRHYTASPRCHSEIVKLFLSLQDAGWVCHILTARPLLYSAITRRWLRDHGIDLTLVRPGSEIPNDGEGRLIMWPGGLDCTPRWKPEVIYALRAMGHDIRFVVEDSKRNAEEIRKVAPVLLYERMKGCCPYHESGGSMSSSCGGDISRSHRGHPLAQEG